MCDHNSQNDNLVNSGQLFQLEARNDKPVSYTHLDVYKRQPLLTHKTLQENYPFLLTDLHQNQ